MTLILSYNDPEYMLVCSVHTFYDKCFITDMSSKLHQTEEGGDSLQTGQDTLTSLVETMEREFTSMKTRQCTLACNVDIMDSKYCKINL